MMAALQFHPLASIFPMMPDAEVNDLGEDMLKHGQREPIWLFEGMILDGRNRYNACMLKDIEPRILEYRSPDALGFVISLNLKRRHLDESQRAIVAGKLATLRDGQRSDQVQGTPIGRAADLLNVSERSVARAREVMDKGTPAIIAAVEQGEVSVSAAAEFAKQPKEDQAKQIEEAATPADAVKASRRAAVTMQADRAEATAAAKLASPKPKADDDNVEATAGATLIDLLQQFELIDVGARMTNDDRLVVMTHIGRANVFLNRTAVAVAEAGGASLGLLAPVSLRFEALEFLKAATARIEAELAGRARESNAVQ